MFKVVFYCESDDFGGHEKMAFAAHAAIQQRYESIQIQWLLRERNLVLTDALEKAGFKYSTVVESPASSLVRKVFDRFWRILSNAATLRRLSPDLVMVVQGNIVLSYGGILSALIGGLRCCSYIPMTFRISNVGKYRYRLLARLIVPLLYKTISSYITVDSEQAISLRCENRNASVIVVENYVPKSEPLDDRGHAKATLGIPSGRKVLTLIGRIAFDHKCQDWVLQELKDDPFLADKFVLFVGDGPDGQVLRTMLTPELRDRFGLIGWKSDLRDTYAATDVLLIPSKNEGVPLVMLEALGYGIPVVGSDQDGMKSWLPAPWRFRWGDCEGFKRGIEQALADPSPDVWSNFAKRLDHVHDEDRFASQFSYALTQYCTW